MNIGKTDYKNYRVENKDGCSPEDKVKGLCFVIMCFNEERELFVDRVYRSRKLCMERLRYLNLALDGKASWFATVSELMDDEDSDDVHS